MRKRLSAYRHLQTVAVREVHLCLTSRRMLLLEVHLSLRPIQRAPVPHTSLQRPQMRPAEPARMTLVQPLEDRRRCEYPVHIRLEHRLYFLRPHTGERVRSRTLPSPVLLLRRQRSLIPVPHRPLAHVRCRRCGLLCLAFHQLLPHQYYLSIGEQYSTSWWMILPYYNRQILLS